MKYKSIYWQGGVFWTQKLWIRKYYPCHQSSANNQNPRLKKNKVKLTMNLNNFHTCVSSISFLTSCTMALLSELDSKASRECSWTTPRRRAGWPILTTLQILILKEVNSVTRCQWFSKWYLHVSGLLLIKIISSVYWELKISENVQKIPNELLSECK